MEEVADYRYRVESVSEDGGETIILDMCAMIEKYIDRKCPSQEQVQVLDPGAIRASFLLDGVEHTFINMDLCACAY